MNRNGNVPPPAPPLPLSSNLNSIRTTYVNLFNQILDSSINIDCICKTTKKNQEKLKSELSAAANRFPTKNDSHDDFMDDDDETDTDEDNQVNNDVEMTLNEENHEVRYHELSSLVQQFESPFGRRQSAKICDLSCFENLKYIHNLLKNCFTRQGASDYECLAEFEDKWNRFKFLRDDPKSCDYYGTTIYHYAASDNNFDLLKCLVKKYPDGVLCLDSKGMLLKKLLIFYY
jgi:hypothetical protein